MSKINCLVVVGELSGEELAFSFIPQIKEKIPSIHFWGSGGKKLEKEGMEVLYSLNNFSSYGIINTLPKIPFYKRVENRLIKEVSIRKCKTAILVDFQTFNLRLAKRLKARGVDVLYYVAPEAWLWREYRAKTVKKCVHTLFTILPFEKEWFEKKGVQRVKKVEHPFVKLYENDLKKKRDPLTKNIRLILLPGSRNSEVEKLLPLFIKVVSSLKKKFPLEVGILPSLSVDKNLYHPYCDSIKRFQTPQEALLWANMGLASLGSIALSCALFGVPTVTTYKKNIFDSFVHRDIMGHKGPLSMVNMIYKKDLFPNFLQDSSSDYNLARALEKWIVDKEAFKKVKESLSSTRELLSGEKNIGPTMADIIQKAYERENDL